MNLHVPNALFGHPGVVLGQLVIVGVADGESVAVTAEVYDMLKMDLLGRAVDPTVKPEDLRRSSTEALEALLSAVSSLLDHDPFPV